MNKSKPVAIALDSEFLKTHGHVLSSAVAFVPFSSKIAASDRKHTVDNITKKTSFLSSPSSLSGRKTQRRMTVFGTPIVLSLDPTEVMSRADVLPCGHCIAPLTRTAFVNGEKLKAIQKRHAKPITEVYSEKNRTINATSRNIYASHTEFNSLCPHSIPNIRRTDKAWLYALYASPVNSRNFGEATMYLSHLRSYGKGRRQERSISFLLRQCPGLLQDVLRASFSTAEAWCAWLKLCGDIVEKELHRVAAEHRQLSLTSSIWPPSTILECATDDNAVQLKVCRNLEEFSYELNTLWSSLMRLGGHECATGTKFYAYGDIDVKAIQNTLRFNCLIKMPYSPRAPEKMQCASQTPQRQENDFPMKNEAEQLANKPQSFTGEMLASPYGAKVVDITRHPLFAASGFRTSPKSIPALVNALEKAAAVDDVAARLHAMSDPHNPVWDAKALACIGTACGIGLG